MRRGAAVAAITIALATASAGAHANTLVRIGAVRTISNGSLLIAVARGYFKEYGIRIEVEISLRPRTPSRCWRRTSSRWSPAASRPATSTPSRRTCR